MTDSARSGAASMPSPAPSPEGFRPAPPAVTMVIARLITGFFPQLATARLLLAIREHVVEAGTGMVSVAGAGINPDAGAADFEYLVWVAWDVWQVINDGDREALLFHELIHCDRDEAGKPVMRPHDAGVFNEEIARYGAWWTDARLAYKARKK